MLMFLFYILSIISSVDELPKEVKAKLYAEFNNYERVEFNIVKTPKNYKSIEYKIEDGIKVIGNTAYISVSIIDKRGKKKHSTISVKYKVYKTVYVAKNEIKKRDPINLTNFELLEKEVTSLRGNVIKSVGEFIGSRADIHIRKGDILTFEMIEKMPIIFPGNKVTAASIVGNVQVTFNVFSRQEGSIGDVIRVRTNDNKIYRAEVLDYKNVLIIE